MFHLYGQPMYEKKHNILHRTIQEEKKRTDNGTKKQHKSEQVTYKKHLCNEVFNINIFRLRCL